MIDSGELNKKISIIYTEMVDNGNGVDVETEVEYLNPWASVTTKSGSEIFKSGRDFNKTITRFLIRYRKDKTITDEMKVKYKDTLYNITYIHNLKEANEFIELIGEVVE